MDPGTARSLAELDVGERARRALAVAGIAGLWGGLILGVLGRIVMRVFAVSIDQEVVFTAGTVAVFVFGLFFGLFAAVLHAGIRGIVRASWPVTGFILAVIWVALTYVLFRNPGNGGEQAPDLARALFAGVAFLGSFPIAWFDARTRRRFEAAGWPSDGLPLLGVFLATSGLVIVSLMILGSLGR